MIALLRFLPLWAKLAAMAALIAALIGTYAYWRRSIYQEGYTDAIEAIAAKDKRAVERVNKSNSRIDDCYARGGVWSQANRVCVGG